MKKCNTNIMINVGFDFQPKIPECKDRNHYCSAPPNIPGGGGRRDDVIRPLQDWINFPGTK